MTDDSAGSGVTRDMERVFAKLGSSSRRSTAAVPPQSPPRVQVKRPATRLGRKEAAWILTMALIAIAGLLALLLTPAPPVATRSDVALPQVAAMPSRVDVPTTAPVVQASSPNEVPPRIEQAPATPRHRQEAEPPRPATKLKPATLPEVRLAKTQPVAPAPAAPASPALPCENVSDQASCLHDDLLEVDHRLRRVYDAAVAAGVPVADLRRARSSWKRALSRSPKEPLVSIGTLEGLTNSLRNSTRLAAGHGE